MFTWVKVSLLGSIFSCAMISFISDAAVIPTSDCIKYSSIWVSVTSLISFLTIISFNPDVKAVALFLKPTLNLS